MYGTQEISREKVTPGMLVKYEGKTYKASANKNGKLYLFTFTERKRISDDTVEVFLNARGEPFIN